MSTASTESLSPIYVYRRFFSYKYLRGDGIEVGALHHPLEVPDSARVKYVDRMSVPDLRKHYPELQSENLVNVDIIDNGETLTTVDEGSQDFVIANHFIEHCQDPVRTIQNLLRVLKKDGILYLAVPDKRFSFDSDRPVTSIEHLLRDYEEGPEWSKREHYEEWVKLVEKEQNQEKSEWMVKQLIKRDYSIHFHVWAAKDFVDLLITLKRWLNFPLQLEAIFDNGNETITILRKC